MKIDFICPIKIDDEKRLKLFEQTFDSLFENTPIDIIGNIIIVDDMSSITNHKYQQYCFRNEKQLGVGGSKNRGIEIAKEEVTGDLIYMFDNDVYFTQGWSDYMLEAHRIDSNKFLIIGGGVHPYLQPRAGEDTNLLTSHDAISGWSWLLSYSVYNKYGRLAENSLGVGKSEDWEYCQRIRNDGFLVGCLKNQVIAHTGMTNSEGSEIPGFEENKILSERIAPQAILL